MGKVWIVERGNRMRILHGLHNILKALNMTNPGVKKKLSPREISFPDIKVQDPSPKAQP